MLPRDLAPEQLAHVRYATTSSDALAAADALVIVMQWKAFRSPDFEPVQTSQDPLLRIDQEQRTAVHVVWPGQSGAGPQVLGQRACPSCVLSMRTVEDRHRNLT